MQLAFPLQFDAGRRTAATDDARHVRDLVEQVLFTVPGERVNRPDFGCGLLDLVFAGNDAVLATASQFTVQGALQRWLGELIAVDDVAVENVEALLRITVSYQVRRSGERRVERFERGV
jgi:phage baseplate assembly protein W